jgi:hypothetical protein
VWFNFDVGTFIFGSLWLAAGIIIGAIKTKGFREKPAVIQELEPAERHGTDRGAEPLYVCGAYLAARNSNCLSLNSCPVKMSA